MVTGGDGQLGWWGSRRRFLRLGALGVAGLPLACLGSPTEQTVRSGQGRLTTVWGPPSGTVAPGEHPLDLGAGRDGFLRVPVGYDAATPAPFALLLHGAGRNAHEWQGGFPVFDALGLVVLSVDSRSGTWDLVYGAYGPDRAFIDDALTQAFTVCNVDPARLGIAGFSDGASYALSLGLTNGDLFTHVLGFSPGFFAPSGRNGRPPVFLAHGDSDPILPVSFTRSLSAQLENDGHTVVFEEFAGGHTLPYAIGERGFGWLVGAP